MLAKAVILWVLCMANTCIALLTASHVERRDCKLNLEGTGPYTLQANLTEQGFLQLCSPQCREIFLRHWIQLHLHECSRIGKILQVLATACHV